jgi:hypothetical protein
MPCFLNYNPVPPRVWSRVQNLCSTDTDSSNVIYDPITNKYVLKSDIQQRLLKGNILQYKKNSSNITKNQRYSQIAKGTWINRTKNYATQTEKYTNPNNNSLLRVNSETIVLPNNIYNPFYCSGSTNTIEDGGNLIGTTTVNPCTKQIISVTKTQNCFPTYCSDVPGKIEVLCWDPKIDTWYPKTRYIMPTSGTKWPDNYKFFVSAVKPVTSPP